MKKNPTLVEILRNSKIGESKNSDDLKRKIADAMSLYLDNHPVLHSNEVKTILKTINREEKVKYFETDRFHDGNINSYCCNVNPFIRASREFKSIKIGEAVSLALASKHPGCAVSAIYKNFETGFGNMCIFYKDQTKLIEYMRKRCSDSPRKVVYDFDFPESWKKK